MHHKNLHTQTARRLLFHHIKYISNIIKIGNEAHFRVLSIRSLTSGSLRVASESDGEHAQEIAIGGLGIDE